ncbi:M23 family metallopeptidase [Kribbella sandramycini]|uniref:M23 family metallopeptidase n=1 Tax=Kribbella sandramycini TaxID=60450 RepID=UPI001EE2FD9E|nr:M23 family metallopeptidase [Kribbella sandramycini]
MAQPLPAGKLTVGTRWRYSKGGLHAAFDYPVVTGTPVFAVADGVVLDCNDGVTNKPKQVTGAPSNWVLLGITHAGRKASVLYQHLSPGIDVQKGQKVKAGQKLGDSGSSGNATGPHLHLAAMWGHRDRAGRYDYLKGIGSKEGVPGDGTASNEICIFPPSLVFSAGAPQRLMAAATVLASGLVFVDKLRFGTSNSDSVKRLQFVLNGIKLKDGRNLKLSGNYDIDTKNEATKWQIQKDGCAPGSIGADGNIGLKQAHKLFGKTYTVKAKS